MVEYGKNVQKRNERMNKKKNGGYGCGSIIALLAICAFLIDVLPIAVALIIIAIIIFSFKKKKVFCYTFLFKEFIYWDV